LCQVVLTNVPKVMSKYDHLEKIPANCKQVKALTEVLHKGVLLYVEGLLLTAVKAPHPKRESFAEPLSTLAQHGVPESHVQPTLLERAKDMMTKVQQ
jgi:hypothetical protein